MYSGTTISDKNILRRRNVVIAGPQGSGKTPLAQMLGGATGQPWYDTSIVLTLEYAEYRAQLDEGRPFTPEKVAEYAQIIRCEKEKYRPRLLAIGDLLTKYAPACLLAAAAKSGATILVGPRRKIEVEAWFKGHPEDIFIEIAPGDSKDNAYELENFHLQRPQFSRLVKSQADFASAVAAIFEHCAPFNLDRAVTVTA